MKVCLHDDIAAPGESGVLIADDGGFGCSLCHRVFRAADEAEQVAVIEVFEAMHLVGHRDRAGKACHDLGRKLEAEVGPGGPDVKE